MATSNKNVTTTDSGGGGETPIIVKDSGGGGETPIIVKDSGGGGETPIIVKDSGGDDPIIIKGGGFGEIPSVNIMLGSPSEMGWTIADAGEVRTIMIPPGATWKIEVDRATGKVYLRRADSFITKMKVDDMVDAINPTVEAPPVLAAKRGNDPEIEIYFSPI